MHDVSAFGHHTNDCCCVCRPTQLLVICLLQGIPPAALAKVTSRPLHDFISTCINPDPQKRPEALQLLRHDFFDSLKPGASACHDERVLLDACSIISTVDCVWNSAEGQCTFAGCAGLADVRQSQEINLQRLGV